MKNNTADQKVYRLLNPLEGESSLALYIIVDDSNFNNLLVKCVNSGNDDDFRFVPTEANFKMTELVEVPKHEINKYPDNFLKA